MEREKEMAKKQEEEEEEMGEREKEKEDEEEGEEREKEGEDNLERERERKKKDEVRKREKEKEEEEREKEEEKEKRQKKRQEEEDEEEKEWEKEEQEEGGRALRFPVADMIAAPRNPAARGYIIIAFRLEMTSSPSIVGACSRYLCINYNSLLSLNDCRIHCPFASACVSMYFTSGIIQLGKSGILEQSSLLSLQSLVSGLLPGVVVSGAELFELSDLVVNCMESFQQPDLVLLSLPANLWSSSVASCCFFFRSEDSFVSSFFAFLMALMMWQFWKVKLSAICACFTSLVSGTSFAAEIWPSTLYVCGGFHWRSGR